MDHWFFWVNEGSATCNVEDAVLCISLEENIDYPWDLGLDYSPIRMEEQRFYRLTFTGWSDQNTEIILSLNKKVILGLSM